MERMIKINAAFEHFNLVRIIACLFSVANLSAPMIDCTSSGRHPNHLSALPAYDHRLHDTSHPKYL
ncbi:hypothetical protein [Neobacillus niacini]|uniref:hypothetical protein n=1 Tax=Neobacillus niacini TaxID=86668 RepID=UPI0021CAFAB0|nr:hypothetical protein [Neobacillus niacini]MCM3766775.1 hypothetical protein [Neobacillus niacini]